MTKTPHARMEGTDIRAMIPEAMAAMGSFNATVAKSGLPEVLLELVKIRASQLNGCAYCLQMHNNESIRPPSRFVLHAIPTMTVDSLIRARQ